MTDLEPVACSLSAGVLQRRLASIAEIGTDGLIGKEPGDGHHVLRFRADDTTRKRLEELVAAEAECCSFLDLTLTERTGELVLTIAAPDEGQPLADAVALAFSGASG